MNHANKTAVAPKLGRVARASNARAIKDGATGRTAPWSAYRAKIESLLGKARDERLADVWQRVCPFPVDPSHELPNRRGIIEDLADFAEVLQPSLGGMKADRLCWLIEKYAAYDSRQYDLPDSHTASPLRSGERVRGRGPHRVKPGCPRQPRRSDVAFSAAGCYSPITVTSAVRCRGRTSHSRWKICCHVPSTGLPFSQILARHAADRVFRAAGSPHCPTSDRPPPAPPPNARSSSRR